MKTLTPTQPSADACTRKSPHSTAAPVSPEVATLVQKLQDQCIKEASAHKPLPGEVVLSAVGKISVDFFTIPGSEAMEINGEHGARTNLYRDYQPNGSTGVSFKPGSWWGTEYRSDVSGRTWSSSVGRLVCDDFGTLVKVTA